MIVIDASVLVDVLTGALDLGEHDHSGLLTAASWQAPAHIDAEVLHALRGLTLGGHLSRPRAHEALTDLADLTIHRWSLDLELARLAFSHADNLTAYDAIYLALASALECPLVTRDSKLARGAQHQGLPLVLLA